MLIPIRFARSLRNIRTAPLKSAALDHNPDGAQPWYLHFLSRLGHNPSSVRTYRKRLGLVHRKVAPISAKAKPEVQEPLLAEELHPVLEEAKHGKRHGFFVGCLALCLRGLFRLPLGVYADRSAHLVGAPALQWARCFKCHFA